MSDIVSVIVASLTVLVTGTSILQYRRLLRHTAPLAGRRTKVREWLERSGYDVLRTTEPVVWRGYVDGHVVERTWCVDFVVRRGGQEYAVVAADEQLAVESADTLCDAWYPVREALDVDGILFVNPEGETVRLVEFELKRPARVIRRRWCRRAGLVAAGVLMAMAWFHAV